MPETYLTLWRYQQLVGNTLRSNPDLQGAWVMAELSDVRVAGGHCYMELVEKDERGGMRAKMRAMIWRNTFETLRRKFQDATQRDIQSGLKVLVRGSASHHEVYGLSFVISDIDPSYTLGDMERLRREILSRLEREGLIGLNRSLPVPATPQRVAVISAAGAAGYGDFVNQLSANPQGYVVYPMLFPAVMQGERTVPTVMAALDWVERFRDMFDCVVIIRGGGATTDLNAFDNYELAARVCRFPLPVVVGIGHERDRTVLDELACVRCKTPTAVAAWILQQLDNTYMAAYEGCRRIGRYISEAMKGEHIRLHQYEAMLPSVVSTRTLRARMTLQQIASRVTESARRTLQQNKYGLERLEGLQRVLSPINTLRRGYSITRVNGHAVSSVTALNPGDIVETTLTDGTLTSEVRTVDAEPRNAQ